jgi:hypothetical protein
LNGLLSKIEAATPQKPGHRLFAVLAEPLS